MIKQAILILSILGSSMCFAQENTIYFDGKTDDWQQQHTVDYDDPDDDGGQIEIESLSITNDETNIYINFTLNKELLLNSNNDLTLYLDTDQNPETGYEEANIGAELRWTFGERRGHFSESKEQIYHNDIGFSALPTVTSDTFEVKINLDSRPDGTHELFKGNGFNLLIKSESGGDAVPNSGEIFTYVIDEELYSNYQAVDLSRAPQTDLRVMSYNVLHDGIVKPERQPYFERILQSAEPDVIVFNECWDTRAVQVRNLLNDVMPLDGDKQWQAVKKDDGNIIASRYFISDSWLIYDDMRLTAALIDLPDDETPRDFLVIGAHFRCCDANEARQREADAFAEFVLDARTGGGRIDLPEQTPIMLAGDLNLVGYSQQLETLLTGNIVNTDDFGEGGPLDWNGSELLDIMAYHSDNPYAYTWIDNESSYWPGRLDFNILTNSVSQVLKKFVMETTAMTDERLEQYGLQREDTHEASDHLPKVVDIKINEDVSVKPVDKSSVTISPNPASDKFYIHSADTELDSIRIISAADGKIVYDQLIEKYNETIKINAEKWERGVYIIEIDTKDTSRSVYRKILIL